MRSNVGLFLSKRAALSPGLEAFIDVATERRFTYSELNARCNATANALAGLGVGRGDRVALLLMNSAEYLETFFAIAKLGAIAVPLNWRLVPDELAFILQDSGSIALVYGEEFANAVADLESRGREGTDLRHWLSVDGGSRADFAVGYAELQGAASTDEPAIGASGDDDLYIMYTSGTTGLPKGAVHSHDTAMWACITINATADNRYRDRYLVALPCCHAMPVWTPRC